MYLLLKKIILSIIPSGVLTKLEPLFRHTYSLFYLGSNVTCPICNGSFNKFQPVNETDFLCIRCGSLPRQRLLWLILFKKYEIEKKQPITLHFTPKLYFSKSARKRLANYYSSEIETNHPTDFHFDITSIDSYENSFDLIICYHILEHIENDAEAMTELHRVLAPDGIVFIQTPFKDGPTYEDKTITIDEERLRAYGQKDHVRIYGKEDLIDRLKKSGFSSVEKLNCNEQFNPDEIEKFGLNKNETIILCQK